MQPFSEVPHLPLWSGALTALSHIHLPQTGICCLRCVARGLGERAAVNEDDGGPRRSLPRVRAHRVASLDLAVSTVIAVAPDFLGSDPSKLACPTSSMVS